MCKSLRLLVIIRDGIERIVADVLDLFVAFRVFGYERVAVRSLRKCRKCCALGKRQIADVLREVRACRGAYPVVSVAEVDRVQIGLEDLIFAEIVFEAPRDEHLGQLTGDAALAFYLGEVRVSRKLLCDRGCAADHFGPPGEFGQNGSEHPSPVESVVLIERLVFYRDEGVLQVVRHFVDRHDRSVFGVVKCVDFGAVDIVEDRRALDAGVEAVAIDTADLDGGHDHCRQNDDHSEDHQRAEDLQDPLFPRCFRELAGYAFAGLL